MARAPFAPTRRSFLGTSLGSGAFLALSACGKGGRTADIAARDGILLYGNAGEPKTLDPHILTGMPEARITSALIEGLVTMGIERDGDVAPGAAVRWESSDDFSRWTFHLREGARWTNGDPVTSSDFLYGWQRILSPALGAQYAEFLYVVRNAEAFNRGQIDDFAKVGVKAPDPLTLEVELIGPMPYFAEMTRHNAFFPVCPAAVEAHGGMTDRQSGWSTAENFVGNGPFRLKAWRTNQMIEIERNPDYWDAANVKLDGVRFLPVENAQTEDTMFFGDQLHITRTIPTDKTPLYRERYPDLVHSDPSLDTYFLRLNVDRAPLGNAKVREALSLAIDRTTLVEKVLRGGYAAALGMVPDGMDGYETALTEGFDAKRARAALAEAGYPGGKGFPAIELLFTPSENARKIAEILQGMWKQVLGIDIGIYLQEWKVYLDSHFNGDYAVSLGAWTGDYVHPMTFLDLFTSGNGNNRTGWKNAAYDALIAKARKAADDAGRMATLHEAEALLMRELPVVPLYWPRSNFLAKPYIKGLVPRLLGIPRFQDLSFDV